MTFLQLLLSCEEQKQRKCIKSCFGKSYLGISDINFAPSLHCVFFSSVFSVFWLDNQIWQWNRCYRRLLNIYRTEKWLGSTYGSWTESESLFFSFYLCVFIKVCFSSHFVQMHWMFASRQAHKTWINCIPHLLPCCMVHICLFPVVCLCLKCMDSGGIKAYS